MWLNTFLSFLRRHWLLTSFLSCLYFIPLFYSIIFYFQTPGHVYGKIIAMDWCNHYLEVDLEPCPVVKFTLPIKGRPELRQEVTFKSDGYFSKDDFPYSLSSFTPGSVSSMGREVPVRYNPKNPVQAEIDTFNGVWYGNLVEPLLYFLFFIIFIIILLIIELFFPGLGQEILYWNNSVYMLGFRPHKYPKL